MLDQEAVSPNRQRFKLLIAFVIIDRIMKLFQPYPEISTHLTLIGHGPSAVEAKENRRRNNQLSHFPL